MIVMFLFILLSLTNLRETYSKDASIWLCLERCNSNPDIKSTLASIQQNKASLTRVAFEHYDLGPNSTLLNNNYTEVNVEIQKLGLLSFPMITTVNHDYIYQVFQNPEPFYSSAVSAAKKYGYSGYNLDWQPVGEMNPGIPAQFAKFLDNFARVLHYSHKELTVDISSSNSFFWNASLIGQTVVDKIITTQTQCCSTDFEKWKSAFNSAASEIPLSKLGIGLETGNEPLNSSQLSERIDYINSKGNIAEISIWDMPLPDDYWEALKNWLND